MGRRGGGHAVWWEIPAIITRDYNYLHHFKVNRQVPFSGSGCPAHSYTHFSKPSCLTTRPMMVSHLSLCLYIPTHTSLNRPVLQPIPWWYPTCLCACTFLHTLLSTVPSYNPSHDGILPVSVLVHSYTHFSPPSRLTTHPMMVSYLSLCLYIPTHTSLHRPVLQPIPWWYPTCLCACTFLHTLLSTVPSYNPSHDGILPVSVLVHSYTHFSPPSRLTTHPMMVSYLSLCLYIPTHTSLHRPVLQPIPWWYPTCLCACTFLHTLLSTVPSYNPSHDGILPVSVLVHSYTHFSPPSRLTTHPMMVSYLSLCLYIPTHTSLHRPVLQPIPWWYPTCLCACTFLHTLLSTVPSYNPSHDGILPVSVLVHSYTHFSPPSCLTTHPMMVSYLSLCLYIPTHTSLHRPVLQPIPWWYPTCLCACTFLHTLLSTVLSYNPSHDGILPVSVLVHSYTHFSPPSCLTTHPMMVSYLSLCLYIPTHTSLHRPVLQPIPWWYPTCLCACTFLHTLLSTVLSYNPSHDGITPVSVLVHSYTLFSPPSHLTTHPMMVSHLSLCLYIPTHSSLPPCFCACTVHSYPFLSNPIFPPIPWGYPAFSTPVSVPVLCISTHLSPSLASHPSQGCMYPASSTPVSVCCTYFLICTSKPHVPKLGGGGVVRGTGGVGGGGGYCTLNTQVLALCTPSQFKEALTQRQKMASTGTKKVQISALVAFNWQ